MKKASDRPLVQEIMLITGWVKGDESKELCTSQ